MAVRALTHQMLRDLRASWTKTALLGGLLLVGFYFWIPLLVSAVSSQGTPAAEAPSVSESPAAASSNTAVLQPAPARANDWQQLQAAAEIDPLARSAEVAAIQSDPFRLDVSQFPPPVLFAEEPPEPAATHAVATGTGPLDGLELKSTVVGVNRRAAFINGKLYFEGSEIHAAGGQFTLAEVHPRRVVLRRGTSRFELTISTADAPASADATNATNKQPDL